MRLREIAPDRYAREVLPLTAELWAGRRTFDEYASQTLEVARGAYGRRCYRTIGLYDGSTLLASFKRYEREIRFENELLRAIGFGAVYTPPEYRGRGYASVMVAAELDRARGEGADLGYLFSDIRPQFYHALGFRTLASRRMTLHADALPVQRIHPTPLRAEDWTGVRRCFEAGERRRDAAMTRGSAVWGWIALRTRHGSEHSIGRVCNLVLRTSRGVRAYVLGARVPERDAYALDEFGFANEAAMARNSGAAARRGRRPAPHRGMGAARRPSRAASACEHAQPHALDSDGGASERERAGSARRG